MMPAIIEPPSEKLTKLKLLLEEAKTEFMRQNSDLLDWLKDRQLQIDRLSLAQTQTTKTSKIDSVEQNLIKKVKQLKPKEQPLVSSITKEEYLSIMEKMIELLKLPAGQLEEESELYLEQQLSDILGFDLSASIDNHRLLFATGIMQAMPHLKRTPTDTLEAHDNYHEAGLNKNRSAFGWFGSEINQEVIDKEKYYIALPLYYHQEWQSNATAIKNWYKFRKAVVINPAERLAVVCSIADIGPALVTKKQFGGSPELIHQGKIWSPKSGGRVLVMFVDDQENSVSYGPIKFDDLFRE